jgi:hypothetical protein
MHRNAWIAIKHILLKIKEFGKQLQLYVYHHFIILVP